MEQSSNAGRAKETPSRIHARPRNFGTRTPCDQLLCEWNGITCKIFILRTVQQTGQAMNNINSEIFDATLRGQTPACIHVADSVEGLDRILLPKAAMVYWRRTVPADVQAWIDDLDPAVLPSARVIVPLERLGQAVTAALDAVAMPEGPGRTFLISDIEAIGARFAAIMQVPYLRLRLNAVSNSSCRKFHVDAVKARMVCTYRGTGTQYGLAADGGDSQDIWTAETGVPLLVRGLEWRETPASLGSSFSAARKSSYGPLRSFDVHDGYRSRVPVSAGCCIAHDSHSRG